MKSSSTRVREHVENVVFRFGKVNIVIGSSESAIVLPKTLPLGLNFVERVRSIDLLLLLMLRFVCGASQRRVSDAAAAATVAEPERRRSCSDRSSRELERVKSVGFGSEGKW